MPLCPPLRPRLPRPLLAAAALLAALPAAALQAPAAEVDRLIAEGRHLLEQRKPLDAEGLFAQAAELDGQTLRTHMWVLRARMDQGGHNNEVLDELDEIGKTHDGPDLDYLFGMAWARRGEESLAASAPQSVDMAFADAVDLLKRATAADPDKYRDAFLPLARAAWYRTDLPTARAAAEQAQQRYPQDPEPAFELGRVALSQFSAAKGDPERAEERAAEAEGAWEVARDAFRRAIELSGEPPRKDARGQSLLAQSYLQLGHTLMWKALTDDAKTAYASALAWNPGSVDLAGLRGTLGDPAFGEVLERAAPAFAKRFGKSDARDAALLWWLGYTRFVDRKAEAAEEAFLASLSKAPDYANAWFYVAMARYDQKNMDGAVEALLKGWEIDPTSMVRETQGDRNLIAKVEYLIGPCVEQERLADAAVLAEICAEGAVSEARHWNNLGLFRRDEGVRLAKSNDKQDRERAMKLFEDSLTAYERALALAPDDPVYLNDTAVVLHYYLDRDLERALALYDRAAAAAEAKLAQGALDPQAENDLRTALRDSTNNKKLLQKVIDERAAKAGDKKPVEAGQGG
jgi:tetratricopeptide (TPR) repeat protein